MVWSRGITAPILTLWRFSNNNKNYPREIKNENKHQNRNGNDEDGVCVCVYDGKCWIVNGNENQCDANNFMHERFTSI